MKDKEGIWSAFADGSLDAIILFDGDGRIVHSNPAARRLLGEEDDPDLAMPERLGDEFQAFAAAAAESDSSLMGRRTETEIRVGDGRTLAVEISLTSVPIRGRRLFAATIRETDEHASRQELEMVRQRLELAVTGASLGIWTYDTKTGAVWYSDRSHEIYGLPPDAVIEARTLRSRVHPDDWPMLAVPYYKGFSEKPIEIEYRVVRPDGGIRWVHALGAAARSEDGAAYTVNGIHLDITDRKQAEEELARSREALHQSEKLAALGSLLAGVSHELNNPLAAIVGQSEMLEEDGRGTPFEERARKISAAADRCARIVRTFLAMARQREPKRELVDVNELTKAALELTEYGLRTAGIRVRTDYGEGLPPIEGDRDQLHQVLVNLFVNAQQAMEKEGTAEKILAVRTSPGAPGEVAIDIADSGPGVPEQLRSRIFEPFFTTKTQGAGTGIGLSFSHGIVSAHGGSLSLEPSSKGARFRITLPAAGEARMEAPPADEPAKAPDGDGARKHALIVDDEPDVAETLRELIEREGYRVTVVGDGSEALEALDREEFDLLFSDMRMPGLGGRELFERLGKTRPDLAERMVFVTGDTIGDSIGDFLRNSGRPILEKPFTKAGVRAVLAELAAPADAA